MCWQIEFFEIFSSQFFFGIFNISTGCNYSGLVPQLPFMLAINFYIFWSQLLDFSFLHHNNCVCILCNAMVLSYHLHNRNRSDFSIASDCLIGMWWSMISFEDDATQNAKWISKTKCLWRWKQRPEIRMLDHGKYLQDHIAEVLEKWDNIDDEIWAKVFTFTYSCTSQSPCWRFYKPFVSNRNGK